jgi:hypothetical protein
MVCYNRKEIPFLSLLDGHGENSLVTPMNYMPLLYLVPISTLTSNSDTTVVSKFDDYARVNDAAVGTASAAVENVWRYASSIEPQTPKLTANPLRKCLGHPPVGVLKRKRLPA